MLYEVMKCAFIFVLPYPVNNTFIIESMSRNQQNERVFKLTQNRWISVWLKFLTVLKFKQRVDMGKQKQNVIGCKWRSKYSDLIVMQDPRSARSYNLLKLEPGSPGSSKILFVWDLRFLGSHGNTAVIGSKIFRIPWENENVRSKIPQDTGSWILGIQDLRSFWDLGTCLPLVTSRLRASFPEHLFLTRRSIVFWPWH